MKVLQLWILRNILEKIELSDSTMGFRSGSNYGIKANAEQHINNEFIMKVDIKDFFHLLTGNKYLKFLIIVDIQLLFQIFLQICVL